MLDLGPRPGSVADVLRATAHVAAMAVEGAALQILPGLSAVYG